MTEHVERGREATDIDALDLHDATLQSATFDWTSGALRLTIRCHRAQEVKILTFFQTTQLEAAREHPWGPSMSINAATTNHDGVYEIELQSGDTWRIHAASWAFVTATIDA